MTVHVDGVVEITRSWIGTPYRHQASVLGAGCDCLGLLRGVWRTLYGREPAPLPPYRASWRDPENAGALQRAAEQYLNVTDGAPEAGAVLLFQLHRNMPPKHCGVMINDKAFVHAQENIGVVEANLTRSWQRRIAGIYHFPPRTEI